MRPADPALAALLDVLAAAAWPAAEQRPLGPWRLRATHGVTHRANSVFTVPAEAAPASAEDAGPLVEAAEAFYGTRGLPPTFQLSPATWPVDLDARLDGRGYAVESPSEVWVADAHDVLDRTEDGGAPGEPFLSARAPDGAWLDCVLAEDVLERRRVREAIIHRIARPRLFASMRVEGVAVAAGLGVSERGWTGVFLMATRPAHRRRGLATAVLHRLAAWAVERGDERLYLQVDAGNATARSVYARSGFAVAYAYWYRLRPALA